MRYQGGKYRLSKRIARIVEELRSPGQIYYEPFCGSCVVAEKISGIRIASDINPYLIALFRQLQAGWSPPTTIDEGFYSLVKNNMNNMSPAIVAFVGIGCSYGGKWFGGFARDKKGTRDLANETYRNLIKQRDKIDDIAFSCWDYRDLNPSNAIIYCDPPYANTTQDGYICDFNHEEFWDVMRKWGENNTVLVSEYSAPEDIGILTEWSHGTALNNQSGDNTWKNNRTERLFLLSPNANDIINMFNQQENNG